MQSFEVTFVSSIPSDMNTIYYIQNLFRVDILYVCDCVYEGVCNSYEHNVTVSKIKRRHNFTCKGTTC